MSSLADHHGVIQPDALLEKLDGLFAGTFGRTSLKRP